MAIDYTSLPVYQQKQKILVALSQNQVIVVQSPTGSGKTTQIPIILHEAGFDKTGVIGVTQPRRIATLSVSEYIAKQLGSTYPGLVGYKMRFDDKTDATTKIKIMTDGILLQELKLDPYLSSYSVIMVDEAHERSLNIDFVLGLLKRIVQMRADFKIIISSATMNAKKFCDYFFGAPIIDIDTYIFPVRLIYDAKEGRLPTTATQAGEAALLDKIQEVLIRCVKEGECGDVLIFLPGERVIKDCYLRLMTSNIAKKLFLLPLYGRLSKAQQERVFLPTPKGKHKVVIATNIAETSVTIDGIKTVIDSGLSKMNFYSPHTFCSTLKESFISKASSNQRRGRAGRTSPGVCYRLYPREYFEDMVEYTKEEIYRTDLSEVVLRMSELGILDFETFDFISPPGSEGIKGAVETLNMLGALNKDNTLSSIGGLMAKFPLLPRISRIITEAMLNYPDVIEETLIAASFLSVQSPFLSPEDKTKQARAMHKSFDSDKGDFVTFLRLYSLYETSLDKSVFCKTYFLDEIIMAQIVNIKTQLEEIVSKIGFPITSGGKTSDYLFCIAVGMIQFVCMQESANKDDYFSLTLDKIQVHPVSSLYKQKNKFIVAGEIIRTSRTFASTVSPLSTQIISRLGFDIESKLLTLKNQKTHEKLQKKASRELAQWNKNNIIIGTLNFSIKNKKKTHTIEGKANDLIKAIKKETTQDFLKKTQGFAIRFLYKEGVLVFAKQSISLLPQAINLLDLSGKFYKTPKKNQKIYIANIALNTSLLDTLSSYVARLFCLCIKKQNICFITLSHSAPLLYRLVAVSSLIESLKLAKVALESLKEETQGLATGKLQKQIDFFYSKIKTILQ